MRLISAAPSGATDGRYAFGYAPFSVAKLKEAAKAASSNRYAMCFAPQN